MPTPTKGRRPSPEGTGRTAGGFRRPVADDDAPPPRRRDTTTPARPPASRPGSTRPGSTRPPSTGTPIRGGETEKTRRKAQGWASVVQKREELDSKSEQTGLREFYLREDEVAIIQYLDDEPFAYESHRVQNAKGGFDTVPCQREFQRHCLMCQAGEKSSWTGAMRVLDYRGAWDKEAKDFTWDQPVEKLHIFGIIYAQQLKAYADKKRRPLSELVIEITKTGSGKSSTHNLSPAIDEVSGGLVTPISWDSEYSSAEELIHFPSDADLEARGY